MATLAFYRGKGTWMDAAIRWWTGSEYSHVEVLLEPVVEDDAGIFVACAASSSPRDGGVRRKRITFLPDHWDLIDLPGLPTPRDVPHIGARYDWFGIVATHIVPLRLHASARWTCSEWIARHVLGLDQAHRQTPGSLHDMVELVGLTVALADRQAERSP